MQYFSPVNLSFVVAVSDRTLIMGKEKSHDLFLPYKYVNYIINQIDMCYVPEIIM
jgi:hypothetical protein